MGGEVVINPKHLEELLTLERRYWWHVAKRALVTEVLKRRFPPPAKLIEGGIGAGWNIAMFQALGYKVTGLDIMPEAVRHCRQLGIHDVDVHDIQEPWPVVSGSARIAVMLDVIEHTSDPIGVLRNAAATLDSKGGIVVTVPAGPYLMGPWDHMVGHSRRYTARLLKSHAREAGLRVAWLSHWNAFSLPAAMLIRTAEKLLNRQGLSEFPRVPPLVNSLLIGCALTELYWIRKIPLPCGLSLIGVLEQ